MKINFSSTSSKRERVMGVKSFVVKLLPFAAMVAVETFDVGLTTLNKAAMSKGLSHFVFVVYANVIASLILLPSYFIIFQVANFHLLLLLI
ncbi:hypothetical protein Patl1_17993 [Pistacia atlantica]|uniref:Uncharacterized protein n=1 Tax=Pistacia atlantica TaxID=434234 RepID=A0ACC1C1L1_9ROSI|nr:hypothetical protein Patl1_17993 [Pistacia atlantica]